MSSSWWKTYKKDVISYLDFIKNNGYYLPTMIDKSKLLREAFDQKLKEVFPETLVENLDFKKKLKDTDLQIDTVNQESRNEIVKDFDLCIKNIENGMAQNLKNHLEIIRNYFKERYPNVPEICTTLMIIDDQSINKEFNGSLKKVAYLYKKLLLEFPRNEKFRKPELKNIFDSDCKFFEKLANQRVVSFIANGTCNQSFSNLAFANLAGFEKAIKNLKFSPNEIGEETSCEKMADKIKTEIKQDFKMFRELISEFIYQLFYEKLEPRQRGFLKAFLDNEETFKKQLLEKEIKMVKNPPKK